MRMFAAITAAALALGLLSPGWHGSAFSQSVKTHFKQYTIFTYDNTDYLCEPYQVKKNDWLYKIFRQKGEISAEDFPRFLRIFKELNPQLSNIDAIAPGNTILIPLKKADKESYTTKDTGIVEVPVLEFSLSLTPKEVEPYIHKHIVQTGDTVSGLLEKDFLKSDGNVSDIGKKTFTSLNPEVKDINRIYTGSHVLIPDSDILSQPWLEILLEKGYSNLNDRSQTKASVKSHVLPRNQTPPASPPPAMLTPEEISRLKRYAQLIRGTVVHQGKVFFPGKDGNPTKILDLSRIPLLEEHSGQKTLLLPGTAKVTDLDQDLVKAVKKYWKGIRLKQLNQALSRTSPALMVDPMAQQPKIMEELIPTLLTATPCEYDKKGQFSVALKHIEMSVSLGRIFHESRPDILVNTGKVYGKAIDLLEQQGYDIFNISGTQSVAQITQRLFSKLGYETWKNPSFYNDGRVETIQGIYINKGLQKHFICIETPSDTARTFLSDENIKILQLDRNAGI